MATKAQPKQRWLYVYELCDVLSEREDVRRTRLVQTRAYSEDQAYLQLTKRFPLISQDNLRLVSQRPVPPRRKKRPTESPTQPALFLL